MYTPQSYGLTPAIWDHSVTCHLTQVNMHRLTPARKTYTRLTNPGGRNAELIWWLVTY